MMPASDTKADKACDTCRVPLLHEEQQVAWLRRRLAAAALVDAVAVLPHAPLFFRVPRVGGRAGKLVTVNFEGFLTVTDPPALVPLLENGIGPAKAFGCGLLLVRRAE